ncbi:hypothetical protein AV944_07405 [Sphingomonas sp. LK11]|nr:hypothetical protein AV944_07405 [Sphingomonas sp. LK11]
MDGWFRAPAHGRNGAMTDPQIPRPSQSSAHAGGIFIALGVVGGIVAGLATGEVTIGVLIGLAIGVAVALLVWWRGR